MPYLGESIDVSAQTTYPTNPQVVMGIHPGSVLFVNESADVRIYFSFDGKADHGVTVPSSPISSLEWTMDPSGLEYSRIWLRRAVAGGVSAKVTVMASENF